MKWTFMIFSLACVVGVQEALANTPTDANRLPPVSSINTTHREEHHHSPDEGGSFIYGHSSDVDAVPVSGEEGEGGIERYPVAVIDFERVQTPFIIGLWIFCASLGKIGKSKAV